eukprot:2842248-Pyramimonas_sp.AAC.1
MSDKAFRSTSYRMLWITCDTRWDGTTCSLDSLSNWRARVWDPGAKIAVFGLRGPQRRCAAIKQLTDTS